MDLGNNFLDNFLDKYITTNLYIIEKKSAKTVGNILFNALFFLGRNGEIYLPMQTASRLTGKKILVSCIRVPFITPNAYHISATFCELIQYFFVYVD